MPGLKQLEKFEKDLFSLGGEESVRRERGEKLSPPEFPQTYGEDDSADFADGFPPAPRSGASPFEAKPQAAPSITIDEGGQDAGEEAEALREQEAESEGEISIPQARGKSLADEDFEDIFGEGESPPDILPNYKDFRALTANDDAILDENPRFKSDNGAILNENSLSDGDDDATLNENPRSDADDDAILNENTLSVGGDGAILDENSHSESDDGMILNENSLSNADDDAILDENAPSDVDDDAILNENSLSDVDDDAVLDENPRSDADDGAILDETALSDVGDDEVLSENALSESDDGAILDENTRPEVNDGAILDENSLSDVDDDAILDENTRPEVNDGAILDENALSDVVDGANLNENPRSDVVDGAILDENSLSNADDDAILDENAHSESDNGAILNENSLFNADDDAVLDENSLSEADDDAVFDENALSDGDDNANLNKNSLSDGDDDAVFDENSLSNVDNDAILNENSLSEGDDDAVFDENSLSDADEGAILDENARSDVDDGAILDENSLSDVDDETILDENSLSNADDGANLNENPRSESDDDAILDENAPSNADDDATLNENGGGKSEAAANKVGGREEDFGIPVNDDSGDTFVNYFNFDEDSERHAYDFAEAQRKRDEEVWQEFFNDKNREVFMRNLARYPLNLRIEIEKILLKPEISAQIIAEIFRLVVKKSSAKVVANSISGWTGSFIETPADFEARSDESFAALSASAAYFIKNRIVPAVAAAACFVGASLLLVLLAVRLVLNPLRAQRAYREGCELVKGEFYQQAEIKFSEGLSYRKSKKWFLRFSDAYREKRQYDRARKIFQLGEAHFPKEKNFPLGWAEMEFRDLGNYERAAEIVRRDVLDNFINLPEGILLLGDIYLDWATEMEAPERFEDALSQYALLTELEGQTDTTLSRMLRYFVRTDNLAEVLPLKSYFYVKNPKKGEAKLGANDMAELGAFLLDKLYGEIAPVDEHLRGYIEDVKGILEQAVNADPSNPAPQYNMARYFIESENPALAQAQLEIALKTFFEKSLKTRRELAQNIDSYRLLGEIYTESGEYLKATETFADGILLYENAANFANFGESPKIGRLYADLADIEYFISGDSEGAMRGYRKAASLGCGTPSIKYRIGCLEYSAQNYGGALDFFSDAIIERPSDSSALLALANSLHLRGDDFAAQGYYERLIEILEAEKSRRGVMFPQIRIDDNELATAYMRAKNNCGVALFNIAQRTGDSAKIARSMADFSESARAWDALTRNPESLVRLQSGNLATQNSRYAAMSRSKFDPEIYMEIPKTLSGEKVLR